MTQQWDAFGINREAQPSSCCNTQHTPPASPARLPESLPTSFPPERTSACVGSSHPRKHWAVSPGTKQELRLHSEAWHGPPPMHNPTITPVSSSWGPLCRMSLFEIGKCPLSFCCSGPPCPLLAQGHFELRFLSPREQVQGVCWSL